MSAVDPFFLDLTSDEKVRFEGEGLDQHMVITYRLVVELIGMEQQVIKPGCQAVLQLVSPLFQGSSSISEPYHVIVR